MLEIAFPDIHEHPGVCKGLFYFFKSPPIPCVSWSRTGVGGNGGCTLVIEFSFLSGSGRG